MAYIPTDNFNISPKINDIVGINFGGK